MNKFAIFGDGKNFDYSDVENELSPLVFSNDTLIVLSGGMESLIYRFAKNHSANLMVVFPKRDYQMPYATADQRFVALLLCDHIITFNTKGQENTKDIEQKAIDVGKGVTRIFKDKKGIIRIP